ncbi:MAG: phage tail assembly protein [Deltaproteobacteria bacterium]|jgi:hypothetical protein|nr:phage tail assembly protein [Deltaproteobacteria bacterium]
MAEVKNKVVELTEPIEFGSSVVGKLALRPPRAKDLRYLAPGALDKLTFGEIMDLAGRLAGQPPEFMDLLSVADTAKVSSAVFDFLSDSGQKTS